MDPIHVDFGGNPVAIAYFRALREPLTYCKNHNGWVAERFKAPVLKTGAGASPPWVRIPPHPPIYVRFQ
jgi:hypothetical protein